MVKELKVKTASGADAVTGIDYTKGFESLHLSGGEVNAITKEIESVFKQHHVTVLSAKQIKWNCRR